MREAGRRPTTVRGLMLAVALAALATAAGVGLMRRRAGFLALAQRHERAATEYRDESVGWRTTVQLQSLPRQGTEPAVTPPLGAPPENPSPQWLAWADDFARLASYHAGLGLKYRSAAAHPWLPIAADPPDPPKPAIPEDDGVDISGFLTLPAPTAP